VDSYQAYPFLFSRIPPIRAIHKEHPQRPIVKISKNNLAQIGGRQLGIESSEDAINTGTS
jgi:hypothetical protein